MPIDLSQYQPNLTDAELQRATNLALKRFDQVALQPHRQILPSDKHKEKLTVTRGGGGGSSGMGGASSSEILDLSTQTLHVSTRPLSVCMSLLKQGAGDALLSYLEPSTQIFGIESCARGFVETMIEALRLRNMTVQEQELIARHLIEQLQNLLRTTPLEDSTDHTIDQLCEHLTCLLQDAIKHDLHSTRVLVESCLSL